MPNRKDGAQLLFFASHHTHDNLDNIPNKLRTLSASAAAPAVDIPAPGDGRSAYTGSTPTAGTERVNE